jgi:hypothetical protein
MEMEVIIVDFLLQTGLKIIVIKKMLPIKSTFGKKETF